MPNVNTDSQEDGYQEEADKEEKANNDDDDRISLSYPLWREICIGVLCCCSQLMIQGGIGQVLGPLPILLAKFPNIIDLYPVIAGSFMLLAGRLGDMYGHRNMMILGFIWQAVWSLIIGLSGLTSSNTFFNIARAFQGLGPAFLTPNGSAVLSIAFAPGKKLNFWLAAFGSMVPTGFVLGATFSGIFAQLAWWPWAFWSMAIACTCLAILSFLLIPKYPLGDMPKGFDYLGPLLGIPGLVLFNVAWIRGSRVGWEVPYTYIILIVGLALFGFFVFIELISTNPLFPYKEMKRRAVLLLMNGFCCFGTFGIWLFYTLQYVEQLRHSSPLSVAAQSVPACVCGIISSILFGIVFGCNTIPHAWLMVLSSALFLAAILMLATMPPSQTYWAQTFLSFIFAPMAMNIAVPTCLIIFAGLVPQKHQGIGQALVNAVINYTIPLTVAIAGTIQHYQTFGTSPDDILHGIRTAAYFGIGLSSLGLFGSVIGIIFTYQVQVMELWKKCKKKENLLNEAWCKRLFIAFTNRRH